MEDFPPFGTAIYLVLLSAPQIRDFSHHFCLFCGRVLARAVIQDVTFPSLTVTLFSCHKWIRAVSIVVLFLKNHCFEKEMNPAVVSLVVMDDQPIEAVSQ